MSDFNRFRARFVAQLLSRRLNFVGIVIDTSLKSMMRFQKHFHETAFFSKIWRPAVQNREKDNVIYNGPMFLEITKMAVKIWLDPSCRLNHAQSN